MDGFNYYNREAETIPPHRLRELQFKRLKSTIERVYHGNGYYRKKFDEKGVKPDDIRHLEGITKLPFTTKEDLFNTYPTGLMISSNEELVRYHMSSGTTGKPKVIPYTKNDIKIWTELMARSLAAIGITRGDVVQNGYGYGLFTGGLGIHQGAEALGATVIPIGGGGTERHLEIMRDMGSTAITCTPSYAIYLGEALHEKGIDPLSLPLKIGHHGAEPWTEEMRAQIEELWGFKEKGGGAYDIYGLSEMGGPGVASECQLKQGSHIWADHFIPEIVDPKTGEPLEPGEWGELVLTSITREAMPLIRYRVGDLTALIPEPCECGRTHPRMEHITGRTDDM
ncbi:MAG: phenylacetate--CoA ligase family protein, partial [Candidatus Bipolaricaulia bacterium]